MKFSIKGFLSKCDQIHRFLRIWSYLLKKSLMENFIFCPVISEGVFPNNIQWLQNLSKIIAKEISDLWKIFKFMKIFR